MTLQQLYYFCALSRLENFTKTASILSISQPSLSYSITQLEEELGVKLFDRNNKKVKLNSYGSIFLTYVESALSTLEKGKENLSLLTNTRIDSIKIGYIYSLTNTLLSEIIEEYYKDYNNRNATFDFNNNLNDKIIEDLESKAIDLAFCVYPPSNSIFVKLFEQELFLMLPKSHRFANRKEIDLSAVSGEDFIFYRHNTGLRTLTDIIFKELGISPNIKVEVDECNAALSFLYLGFGLVIMPIVPGIDLEKVSILKIREPSLKRPIYLAWKDDLKTNQITKEFRDFVINIYDPNYIKK